jgi:hypothetical protein
MPQIDLEYLEELGLKDRLDAWRERTKQLELVS